MTMSLTYESEYFNDDVRIAQFAIDKANNFPHKRAFANSMWKELCDSTSFEFHKMKIAKHIGDQVKFTWLIIDVDEYRIIENASFFMHSALGYFAVLEVDFVFIPSAHVGHCRCRDFSKAFMRQNS